MELLCFERTLRQLPVLGEGVPQMRSEKARACGMESGWSLSTNTLVSVKRVLRHLPLQASPLQFLPSTRTFAYSGTTIWFCFSVLEIRILETLLGR